MDRTDKLFREFLEDRTFVNLRKWLIAESGAERKAGNKEASQAIKDMALRAERIFNEK